MTPLAQELQGSLVTVRYASGSTERVVNGEWVGVQPIGSSGFAVLWVNRQRMIVRLAAITAVEVHALPERRTG